MLGDPQTWEMVSVRAGVGRRHGGLTGSGRGGNKPPHSWSSPKFPDLSPPGAPLELQPPPARSVELGKHPGPWSFCLTMRDDVGPGLGAFLCISAPAAPHLQMVQ